MSQCRSPGSRMPATGWASHDETAASASDAVRGMLEYAGIRPDPHESPQREPCEAHELAARTAPLRAKLDLSRADPPSDDRHRVAGLRRRGSPVKRPFHLLDQLGDIVEGKPWLEIPRSRALTLNGCRGAVVRRLASPRRSVSLTISRKGRPARRDSALSLAATSSSRVRVVRML